MCVSFARGMKKCSRRALKLLFGVGGEGWGGWLGVFNHVDFASANADTRRQTHSTLHTQSMHRPHFSRKQTDRT